MKPGCQGDVCRGGGLGDQPVAELPNLADAQAVGKCNEPVAFLRRNRRIGRGFRQDPGGQHAVDEIAIHHGGPHAGRRRLDRQRSGFERQGRGRVRPAERGSDQPPVVGPGARGQPRQRSGADQPRIRHNDRVVPEQQRGVQVRPGAAAPADSAVERFGRQVHRADPGAEQQANVGVARLKAGQAGNQP